MHGTGIGLSMYLGLVSAHGGTLHFEQTASGGAGFIARFPAYDGASPAIETTEPETDATVTAAVFVIDDENDVGEILSDILTWGGHTATIATSGNAALEMLAKYHYDVILCDMHMPDLNGRDFFRRLEVDYPELCQRVAFITGDALGAPARQFFLQVNRPAIQKPFQPQDILQLVAEICLSQKIGIQANVTRRR